MISVRKTALSAGAAAKRINLRFISSVPEVPAQSSNRTTTWSKTQQPKKVAAVGPRFEQTHWDYQPNPPSAMELIHEEPIRFVEGRVTHCDGDGGALGHPRVYINLDKGVPVGCGYCGIKYQQKPHHH
ncbi:uncharacterized protein BJ171DRAFT_442844 [Polychytrium aggregatum]|uniref:uncharacterized protein n=1 Tax=Polychytrium aggregatum TaxID=110093 RepID=UPI0022FF3947|nr:uncharacterized protein BJ171DRAFT_442844 [Polychytrium aggregatum]KAI9204007.1 hypothetical protein BJ171DRAFT_442844 [Polychytrium aggregatum]